LTHYDYSSSYTGMILPKILYITILVIILIYTLSYLINRKSLRMLPTPKLASLPNKASGIIKHSTFMLEKLFLLQTISIYIALIIIILIELENPFNIFFTLISCICLFLSIWWVYRKGVIS
jgi:hypothetical protein